MKHRIAQVQLSSARNPLSCCLAVTLPLLGCGCATVSSPPTYVTHPAPPSEEVRATFGLIAIVAEARTPEIARPLNKGRAAGAGAFAGFVLPPKVGGELGDGYGFVLGLFLSPLTAAGGAIYGACAGMSEDEYEQIVATLRMAARESSIPGRLETGCIDATRQLASWALTPTNAPAGETPTRLEIVPSFALDAREGIDPPLTLNCAVQVRLLSGSDGAELFTGQFNYIGAAHPLRQWAADNGAEFRNGIATACDDLAGQIAERVFLVYALPDDFTESRSIP